MSEITIVDLSENNEPKIKKEAIIDISNAATINTMETLEASREQEKPQNPNDFSYWFPKIKDCGINVPKTQIFQVPDAYDKTKTNEISPDDIQTSFYMEREGDEERIRNWLTHDVLPALTGFQYFMKNSRFSNKFEFNNCITNKSKMATDLISINYAALCVGAEGIHELVLREIIKWDESEIPCIYSGMPLRTEFRVFYDFDTNKILYTTNYWDYDYVRPNLTSKTDQIIFDAWKDEIQKDFENNVKEVEALVATHMKDVKGLTDQWSIDILLDKKEKMSTKQGYGIVTAQELKALLGNDDKDTKEFQNNYWLIDMAVAQNSAYWNPAKCKQ